MPGQQSMTESYFIGKVKFKVYRKSQSYKILRQLLETKFIFSGKGIGSDETFTL